MRLLLFLCSLLLVGLPQGAGAAGVIGMPAGSASAGSALERAAAPAASVRKFDLHVDGGQLHLAQGSGARRSQRGTGSYDAPSDRGLSFGFEIQPRSRLGALARQEHAEDPSLGDQLEKLIDRPVFGFRGRYRF
jgi:hypothetical protein